MKELKAGFLTAEIDNGFIRYIQLNEAEVLQMIYFAVRDGNWGTIPFRIENFKEKIEESEFNISFDAIFTTNQPMYKARITILGNVNSTLYFNFEGEALETFERNRIGLCVHHPLKECVGNECKIIHSDGSISLGQFPQNVMPHQPFKNISEIEWGDESGYHAHLKFEGDIFEMEDQRNWTDASFKTYSTPLDIPFPVRVNKGDKVVQQLTLHVSKVNNEGIKAATTIVKSNIIKPKVGLGLSTSTDKLTQFQAKLLNKLNLNHIRIDVNLFRKDWKIQFHKSLEQIKLIPIKIELVIHVSQYWEIEIQNLISENIDKEIIDTIILFEFRKAGLSNDIISKALPLLRNHFYGIKIGTGTDANFAELNRSNIDPNPFDFLTFGINPQVHLFDDRSVLENAYAQKEAVQSALVLSKGKPIHISAITLKPRFNAVAKDPNAIQIPLTDERQTTEFCAKWTAISLKSIREAGASSVTYFETVGLRGIMNENAYPVYEVFENYLSN
ncbi:MAG: hypothetical protein SFY32_16065 [Bacteroidota bacterium]|nr:hypothetical protein [Bacteroidota bacterium]